MGGARTVRAPTFRIGQRVEVSLCRGHWFPATIVEIDDTDPYPITVERPDMPSLMFYKYSEVRPFVEAKPVRKRRKKR